MTLFCVRDGDAANDSKGWNQPLKKVERPNTLTPKQQYIPTSTPGVVIDSSTGKMETQIPENEVANPVPATPVIRDNRIIYWGDRLDWLANKNGMDCTNRGDVVRFNGWIIKGEVIEATRVYVYDVPTPVFEQFCGEKVKTRFYKHGVDAYFIDMSDAWFHIKDFPAFRHCLVEPKVQTYLKHTPTLLTMDDIKDQKDPTDFSDWLQDPTVQSYLKR